MILLEQKEFFEVATQIIAARANNEWYLRTDGFVLGKARGGVRGFTLLDSAAKLVAKNKKASLVVEFKKGD